MQARVETLGRGPPNGSLIFAIAWDRSRSWRSASLLLSSGIAHSAPPDYRFTINFSSSHLGRILSAARRAENMPYTILGSLLLISLLARLILIFG